ncbi:MAG: DNA polymerase III subunit chi [Rhizobiales bacterium]|nr:DNA polymerase III subunit chi [Hyphomicrobiales bacterium]
MTEILFYHLERQSLEQVLPQLVSKCIERDWPTLIVTISDERLDVLDSQLWTYSDQSFLAHGKVGDGDDAEQPVLLSTSDDPLNKAEVCFLVDGATTDKTSEFNRIVHLFDGRQEAAVEAARDAWKALDREANEVTYWQQDGSGQWVKKA